MWQRIPLPRPSSLPTGTSGAVIGVRHAACPDPVLAFQHSDTKDHITDHACDAFGERGTQLAWVRMSGQWEQSHLTHVFSCVAPEPVCLLIDFLEGIRLLAFEPRTSSSGAKECGGERGASGVDSPSAPSSLFRCPASFSGKERTSHHFPSRR